MESAEVFIADLIACLTFKQ